LTGSRRKRSQNTNWVSSRNAALQKTTNRCAHTQTDNGRDSIEWVLIAKGIGILLVVAGHFYPDTSPAYWSAIRDLCYSFHMPLFFLVSGYLYSHGKYPYPDLIAKKTKRLLYPFLSIAALFSLIKLAAGRIVALDNPVTARTVGALLTDPVHSFMPLLWYIHTLFLIFVVYPLLRMQLNTPCILLALLLVNTVAGTDYPVFGRVAAYMPFFVCGILLKENSGAARLVLRADRRCVYLLATAFLAVYVLRHCVAIGQFYDYCSWFTLALLGSTLVISASSALASCSRGRVNKPPAVARVLFNDHIFNAPPV